MSIIETYENYIENQNKLKRILCDFDDVLTDSAIKQFKLFSKRKEFNNYFKPIPENVNINDYVNSRKTYLMIDLMHEGAKIDKEYMDITNEIYAENDFYANLSPTKYAIALKEYLLYNPRICEKLTIISKNLNEKQEDSKIKWIVDFFGIELARTMVDFYSVDNNNKKSNVIKENNIKFDIYAEDNLDNVKDVYNNCDLDDIFGTELIIPAKGYNLPNSDLALLEKIYNIQIYYIEN